MSWIFMVLHLFQTVSHGDLIKTQIHRNLYARRNQLDNEKVHLRAVGSRLPGITRN